MWATAHDRPAPTYSYHRITSGFNQKVVDCALATQHPTDVEHMTTMLLLPVSALSAPQVEWTQTAKFDDGYNLLKPMKPLKLSKMAAPDGPALTIDRSSTYQEILGFGGAFTEAAALNWRTLSASDQAKVIKAYFASPEEGGLGYTVGRVPINSCDFGPGDVQRTYSFDNVSGDVDLLHFDDTVAHDVQIGIIPMIQAARDTIAKAGNAGCVT